MGKEEIFLITHIIWDLGDTIITPPASGQDLKPLNEYGDLQLRPDALETLRELKRLGYRQAVLSNTATTDSEGARRLLARLGVAVYFDFIYATQSELSHDKPEKPNPEVFKIVLTALMISPHQAVMVGNSWDNDIVGANRSGIHSVWLINPSISARRDMATPIQNPPWIIPVWDLDGVPKALEVLQVAFVEK